METETTPDTQDNRPDPDAEGRTVPKRAGRTVLVIVLALGAVAIVGVVLLGMAIAPWLSLGSHASDAAMTVSFRERRAEYGQLLRAFQEHKKLRSMDESTGSVPSATRAGLGRGQAEDYRRLMKELGVQSIERYFGKILFVTSTSGLSVSGSMKGYVYATKTPSPLVENTEDDAGEPVGENYHHIEDDWYIMYEWDT